MGLSGLLLKSSEIKRREKDIRAGEPSYMAQGTDISTWNTKNYQ